MVTKTGIVIVDSTNPPPENLGEVFYNFLANIDGISTTGLTSFVAHSTDFSTFDVDLLIQGSGFKYDNNIHQTVTAGTITSFTITDHASSDPLVHATFNPGISASAAVAAANFLSDHPGDTSKLDAIFNSYAITFDGHVATTAESWSSGNTNDTLTGGAGNDILIGGGGNDTIEGGAGNDNLDGGAGTGDTVSYASSDSGVTVDLGTQATADDEGNFTGGSAQSGGHAQGDFIAGFENIIGSANNDVLTGNASNNVISGGDGDDSITGGAGNDTLDGGDGDDSLNLAYLGAETNLTVTLGEAGVVTKTAGIKTDIDSIKNFEDVLGGDGNDTITGNSADNVLQGGAGDDILEGRDGDDTLDGGNGTDTASYAHSAMGVSVDLDLQGGNEDLQGPIFGTGSVANGDAAGDTLRHIENLIGSTHDDVLISGTQVDDVVRIDGGAGNDIIVGSGATDSLIGGVGIDTLSYQNSIDGVTVSLATQATLSKTGVLSGGTNGVGGDADGDMFTGFENLRGGGGADSLTGDKNANIIEGGGAADFLDGGLGFDLVSYEHSAPVSIDLTLQGTSSKTGAPDLGTATAQTGIAHESGDLLYGFEGVIGSDGGDQLFANQSAANTAGYTLIGGNGDDYMQGGFGKDILQGGAGDDEGFLGLGKGGDTFDGGDGDDWATFNSGVETAGITITLGTDGTSKGFKATGGAAAGSKITNVENVGGTTLNDVLTGNNLDNQLDGGALGNDVLSGMAGNDTLEGVDGDDKLIGGAGNDILDGGVGIDTVDYSASKDGIEIDLNHQGVYLPLSDPVNPGGRDGGDAGMAGVGGDAAGDHFWGIENVIGTKLNDTVTASAAGTTFDGGAGDDTFFGGSGNDQFIGNTGVDAADYSASVAGVTVNLSQQFTAGKTGLTGGSAAQGGDAAGDQLSGVEQVFGGQGDNILIGDKNNNLLVGQTGNDRLDGGAGNDVLSGDGEAGSGGNDTFVYDGQGKDIVLDFNKGEDTLEFTGGLKFPITSSLDIPNYVSHDDDGNVVISFDHKNTLTLQGFTGTLDLNDIVSNLPQIGTNAPEELSGDDLANKIDGAGGDDTIEGNEGGDTLIGGTGNDWLSYAHSGAAVTVELVAKAAAVTSGGDADGDTATLFENIVGSANVDMLTGDSGNNMIAGGVGNDIIDGGEGIDTANYSYLSAGSQLTITLGANGAASTATYINGDEDTLSNIENLIGGSENDIWTGNDGVNVFKAGAGDDHLNGGGGGKDTLDGGDGDNDTADFAGVTIGLTIALKETGSTAVTGGGNSTGTQLIGIEHLIGGDGNDVLTGTSGDNILKGGDGNDIISGGVGDDTLVGNTGDDKLTGGAGADILDGGEGSDTVDYSASAGGIMVDLTAQGDYLTPGDPASGFNLGVHGTAGHGGDAQDDFYYGIENVIGTKSNDTLIANSLGSRFDGGAGDDELAGGTGNDILIGGAGNDYALYENSAGGVTVDLSRQWTVDKSGNLAGGSVAHGGDAEGDQLSGIESVTAGTGEDVLIGDGNANTLNGGDGNDRLDGGAGNDTLSGGDGGDTFVYNGQGKDTILDFTQNDDVLEITGAASFTSAQDVIDAAVNDGVNTVITFDTKNTLTLTGFTGTLTEDDIIFNAPVVDTKDSHILVGNALVNKIDGAAGDDTIEGKEGGDTLIGGVGNDWLSYEHSGSAVSVTLVAKQAAETSGGDADGDNATLFENIIGSGYNDTLNGDTGNNVISGGLGDDTIDGGAGNDTVDYSFLASNELTITLDGSGNATTSGVETDTLSNIENLAGGGENDHFTGNAKVNIFRAGAGDDHLVGGGGKDILDGGDGFDQVDFTGLATGITVALKDTGATAVSGGGTSSGTQLISIERIDGTDGNDVLTGNASSNSLFGGDGDDKIFASRGDLEIYGGGDGTDTLTFEKFTTGVSVTMGQFFTAGSAEGIGVLSIDGFESLTGGKGNDILGAGGLGATVNGGAGDDTIIGGMGVDTLIGGGAGKLGDTLSYAGDSVGVEVTFHKSAGADLGGDGSLAEGDTATGFVNVIGGTGDDVLDGSLDTSKNVIDGGADGADTLTGGAEDTVSYASALAGVTVQFVSGSDAITSGAATNDVITGFKSIIGSDFSDLLNGASGGFILNGGLGDDILGGGTGANTLIGGVGTDVASFNSPTTPAVTVNLAAGTAVRGGATDTLQSIETIFGSTNGDIFNATGFSHSSKNAGDTGIGNEEGTFNSFVGGAGNDSITGNGATRVRYDDLNSGVAVNLDTENHFNSMGTEIFAQTARRASDDIDTFHGGISQVEGSNSNDRFWGGAADETFIGLKGNDAIDGGSRLDAIDGSNGGFDTARYNIGNSLSGADGITVDLAGGNVNGVDATAIGFIGHDTLLSIESIIGTNANDIFNAAGFDASSTNGGSNGTFNSFEGVGGDDTVTGNGNTRVSYQRATGGVVVELHAGGAGTASGDSSVGNDTFTGGVNAVRGSEFNDEVTGNGQGDTLDGWLGNDILTGGAGGTDIFKYSIGTGGSTTGGGADHIVGFELGLDQIDLRGVTSFKDFTALQKLMSDSGNDVVIDFGHGNTLTIDDHQKADLTVNDFILLH
jgi:Ca2+-binding RTX toxin-like protein